MNIPTHISVKLYTSHSWASNCLNLQFPTKQCISQQHPRICMRHEERWVIYINLNHIIKSKISTDPPQEMHILLPRKIVHPISHINRWDFTTSASCLCINLLFIYIARTVLRQIIEVTIAVRMRCGYDVTTFRLFRVAAFVRLKGRYWKWSLSVKRCKTVPTIL